MKQWVDKYARIVYGVTNHGYNVYSLDSWWTGNKTYFYIDNGMKMLYDPKSFTLHEPVERKVLELAQALKRFDLEEEGYL